MITQELIAFIKQQLQEGKSKEQIATTLTPHGWALEDINGVFAQIMPTAQPAASNIIQPETIAAVATAAPITAMNPMMPSQAMNQAAKPASFMSPMSSMGTMATSPMQNTSSGTSTSSGKGKKIAIIGVIIIALAIAGYLVYAYGNISELISGKTKTVDVVATPIETIPLRQNDPIVTTPNQTEMVTPTSQTTTFATTPTAPAGNTATGTTQVDINPEFAHVKDAFPAGFPLPTDKDVITATVLSASTFEGVRYVLDYTSIQSSATLRTAIKNALEKGGYVVSVNEANTDLRVIFASKIVNKSVQSIRVILEKTVIGVTVHTVITQ